LTAILWPVAAGLTWLGIVGDQHGWWTSRPFLLNLYSATVGACFGIPIALVVLGELAGRQRSYSDRLAATTQAATGLYAVNEALLILVHVIQDTRDPFAKEGLPPIQRDLQVAWAEFVAAAPALGVRPSQLARADGVLADLSTAMDRLSRERDPDLDRLLPLVHNFKQEVSAFRRLAPFSEALRD
jgi:hypothetical protein